MEKENRKNIIDLIKQLYERESVMKKIIIFKSTLEQQFSSLNKFHFLKRNNLKSKLQNYLLEYKEIKIEIKILIDKINKCLENVSIGERALFPIFELDGDVLKKTSHSISFSEFIKTEFYNEMFDYHKNLIKECGKYLTDDFNDVQFQVYINYEDYDISITSLRFVNLDNDDYVEAWLYKNIIKINRNGKSECVKPEMLSLDESSIKRIYDLEHEALEHLKNGGSSLDKNYLRLVKEIEGYLSYATLFQKAQLPTVEIQRSCGNIHHFLVPSFIDINRLIECDEIKNNSEMFEQLNKAINYFKQVYGVSASFVNFRINESNDFTKIGLKFEKSRDLPVYDYEWENIATENEMIFDFVNKEITIRSNDYDSMNNSDVKIPMPEELIVKTIVK